MKKKHFIDSHKGATPIAVLSLMAIYGSWDNLTAWIYLATHGTYGLLWVLKSLSFPDKQWEEECGPGFGLYAWLGLTLYWITPWLIVHWNIQTPPWLMALAVSMFGVGVFLHFAADMQKHTALALRPGLITTGLWARCRNPNYFGELLIYVSFALLAEWWAWGSLAIL
ncbi:MAG: DUF1295 domain-containing protein, partial [Proteobacteria bacterium]|nr:DUF1295 domain-containing protein [Pseudomonadota bacterium]